ncbi:hypothetical protein [Treponema sp.]|uniref:hypothetical protein n=1 Tax=Treponema sp. TaxID=166 RepID=UPI0025E8F26E|nr:hypothetical protein [Treponema sp.]MBR4322003.1 hypothetical protein [Treponema sp.]
MTIKDCVGEKGLCGILVYGDSSGAFVGGEVILNKDTENSTTEAGSALAIFGGSLYVSSSTIFANSQYYGAPVKVANSASLNFADGFEYKKINESDFTTSDCNDGDQWINMEYLNLTTSANKITAGISETDTNSTDFALVLGKHSDDDAEQESMRGALYISGNSSIYGVVDLFFKSSIGVTGVITSGETIKVKFEEIGSYTANVDGDYPLFWAAGSDRENANKSNAENIPNLFSVYGNSGYAIGASGRYVQYAVGENNGNTIYAPVK